MSIIDFHSHLIPGVDDGAQNVEESRAALSRFREQGVRVVITTPHLDGSLTQREEAFGERLEALDRGWEELKALAEREFPELEVHRGTEVKLDTPEPNLEDGRVRLAGTRFVLVEFPHMMVPPESARALFHVSANGWTPVVAHPERYADMARNLELVEEWRRVGAYLQVNHGSLLGRYGEEARRVALALLRRGWVSYLSSDYHARGWLHIESARDSLGDIGGQEQVKLLTQTNPQRLLEGQPPLPVPPLQPRRGFFARIFARFR